jgi:hypothetical protein
MKVHGSCHCENLAFEADVDPEKAGICHCTDCQKLTSSAFSTFVPVPKAAFRLTRGTPKIYVKTAESGNRRAQAFCAECGTRIYASAVDEPQVFNVRLGTLAERAALRPRVQVWCRSAMPWVAELGAIKQVAKQP